MKLKRVLALIMSAALIVSAPFSNAGLVHAEEAAAQDSGAAESEGEASEEAWSGTVEFSKNPAEEMKEEKVWKPSEKPTEQASGVKISDEMLQRENRAETSEPKEEEEKSGKVIMEETEGNEAASDLIRNGGAKQDSVKELLNEETVGEQDPVRVIIILEEDSVIENNSQADINALTRSRSRRLERKQDSVIAEIEDNILEGDALNVRYQYTWLLNGVATEVPYGIIDEIRQIDGVKEVILQPVYNVAENSVTPYTMSDGEMIGRDDTWKGGYTGKGIVISVIDTGIDDDHQNFAALSESQLTGDSATRETVSNVLDTLNAKALRPDITADDVYRSTKIAYGFNYVDENLQINHGGDNQGDHGTHVAGIAAANELQNNEAVGVAPEAQLYVMKVFGAKGGAYTDDILAALEDSLILGADVVNMSLGSPAGFTSDGEMLDEIYGRVSDTNTILAVAAGNSTSSGKGNMWGTNTNLASNPDNSIIGSPATYVNATSVASVDNAKLKSQYIEVNGSKVGYLEGSNGTNAPIVGTLGGNEYGFAMVPNCGQEQSDFTGADVAGKVAVVSRGITAFSEKVQFAENAGAVACLIYNNEDGSFGMDMSGGESTIPCASVTMQTGALFAAAYEENPEYKMAFSREEGFVPNETAYRMSSFSSWGISPDLLLEPDVTAPGGNIYSTLDGGKYGLMSGTSMATPNVAGISALIMQYAKDKYPEMSASELHAFVNALLVSTAEPLSYDEATMFSPRSQGAGLTNAFKAVTTKAYLTVDGMEVPKAELMDDPGKTGAYTFNFRVHNFGDADAYYKLSTNVQTENVYESEETGMKFMDMTPVALDAGTKETSDNLVYIYDYNENGKTNSSDARSLYLKVIRNEAADANDSFRYDLDGSEDAGIQDVQTYLDALVGKSDVDLQEQVLKVAKGEEASVSVDIQVTDAGKSYMDSNFENGIYVEGFTMLEAKNAGGVDLSIPYMGFYGDWTEAPLIDSGFYWESDEEMQASQYVNVIFTNYGPDKYWYPGVNPYVDEPFDVNHISVSPNGDGYGDYFEEIYLSLLRNASVLQFTYADTGTGAVYFDDMLNRVPKSCYNDGYEQIIPFVYSNYMATYDFTDAEGNVLANNTKLNFTIRGELDYDVHEQANDLAVWELPVIVDTEAPVVEAQNIYVDETDGKRYLELNFRDNVAVAAMNFLNKSNTIILKQYPVEHTAAGESCTMRFDITGFGNQFNLVVGDYAFNERTYVIRTEDNDPILDKNLLYGYRVADSEYTDDRVYGWIGIDKEGAETTVYDSEYFVDYALTAAEYIGGYIVAVDADNTLVFIKPGYWDERTQIAKLGVKIREMAFDPAGKKLYAYNSTDGCLCTIDIASGAVSNIGTYLSTVIGMACDDDGVLYGIDDMGSLRILDKENGTWGDEVYNTFKETEFMPYYAQSMTYDSGENAIYWAAFDYGWAGNVGMLYRYSIDDKTFTEIGTIAGDAEVVGLLKLDDRGYQLPEAELTAIGLEQQSISMLEGNRKQLNLILTPWYGKQQELSWSSSDPKVAEVSQSGEVTGIGAGQAVITVRNEDGSLQASCDVSVISPRSALKGFALAGQSLQNQWVSFTADDVRKAKVLTEADFRDFFAGEYLDGYIYAYSSATELYRIDAEKLTAEKISDGNSSFIMQDMAYDYSSGFMYGIAQDMMLGETSLVIIDTMTGETRTIGTIADEYDAGACALAVSTEGTIYVITYTGILYTVDSETCKLEKIGYTGNSGSQYTQCMAYDHNTDELYWAMLSGTGEAGIMYVDTRTGAAINLGTFDGGAQVTSMYVVPETIPARPDVPVDSMELTIAGDRLRMLAGSRQVAPVRVLPYNATDRTVAWTVADSEVASVEGGMITAKKAGSTVITGTKEIKGNVQTVTFTLEVLESAGKLYGYIASDFSTGGGQFWGSFLDNNLAEGEGLADAAGYILNAGTWYDGKIYGYGVNPGTYAYQYMVIDGSSFTLDEAIEGTFPDMQDMAMDYTQGSMYAVGGVRNVESNTTLYTVDIRTGEAYQVAGMAARIMTLACTAEGELYGVDKDGVLYRIDKETGELHRIGETGYGASLYQSMAYDYNTGNLYWAQANRDAMMQTTGNLLLVDTTDASVLNLGMVGVVGSQITSLYTIPEEEIQLGTPEITKILMGSESEMLKAGDEVQLSAIAYPLSVNPTAVRFTYQSSDTDVAKVNEDGLVTAVSAGTAVITVSAGDVSASCNIRVVGEDKVVYAVNTNGWEVSPLLYPDKISEAVELPENAGFTIVTATYCSGDGYFYAVGTDGYLWKYTEDLKTVQKIGADTVVRQLSNYNDFLGVENEYSAPKVIDIAGNSFNDKVYVLAQGVEKDKDFGEAMHFYIYQIDLQTGVSAMAAEVPMEIGRPDEFVFAGENEIFIYDALKDNIFRMSLEDGSLSQVAWTQGVFASGNSNAMAYSAELNMIFIATADNTLGDGIMALYVINPATGKVYKYADAAYAATMVDLILIEGSTPAVTAEAVPTETPDGVKPTETPGEVKPTETPDGVKPTETPDGAVPTETPDGVKPTETPGEVKPTETPGEVKPTEAPDEAEPTEEPGEVKPTEAPDEVKPTETPGEVKPTEAPDEAEPTEEPAEALPTEPPVEETPDETE